MKLQLDAARNRLCDSKSIQGRGEDPATCTACESGLALDGTTECRDSVHSFAICSRDDGSRRA